MNQPAEKERALRALFPNVSASALQNLERYFELALEIVEQSSIPAKIPVDISDPISTLKERSNSNLKNQS